MAAVFDAGMTEFGSGPLPLSAARWPSRLSPASARRPPARTPDHSPPPAAPADHPPLPLHLSVILHTAGARGPLVEEEERVLRLRETREAEAQRELEVRRRTRMQQAAPGRPTTGRRQQAGAWQHLGPSRPPTLTTSVPSRLPPGARPASHPAAAAAPSHRRCPQPPACPPPPGSTRPRPPARAGRAARVPRGAAARPRLRARRPAVRHALWRGCGGHHRVCGADGRAGGRCVAGPGGAPGRLLGGEPEAVLARVWAAGAPAAAANGCRQACCAASCGPAAPSRPSRGRRCWARRAARRPPARRLPARRPPAHQQA